MKKYYIRSLFHGWKEVTEEQQREFVELLRKNITAMSGDEKEKYIQGRIRTEERP